MVSLNVVRVDFAQARALRAGAPPRAGWSNLRAASSTHRAPSPHAQSLSTMLTRFLACYRARRTSIVERILRKGIAALE